MICCSNQPLSSLQHQNSANLPPWGGQEIFSSTEASHASSNNYHIVPSLASVQIHLKTVKELSVSSAVKQKNCKDYLQDWWFLSAIVLTQLIKLKWIQRSPSNQDQKNYYWKQRFSRSWLVDGRCKNQWCIFQQYSWWRNKFFTSFTWNRVGL